MLHSPLLLLFFFLAWQLGSPDSQVYCHGLASSSSSSSSSSSPSACPSTFSRYNDSGTIDVPYPRPPILGSPTGSYKLSTYTFYNQTASLTEQSFAATNTSGGAVLDEKVPYQGCIIVLTGVNPAPRASNNVNTPNQASCSAALSAGCLSSIVEYVNSTALGMSENPTTALPGSSSNSMCPNFATEFANIPGCNTGAWGGVLTADFFTSSPNLTSAAEYEHCQHSSNIHRPAGFLFGTQVSTPNPDAFYHSLFTVTPVIITAWADVAETGSRNVPWADTRMMCITPNILALGSHQKSDGGFSQRSRVWTSFGTGMGAAVVMAGLWIWVS